VTQEARSIHGWPGTRPGHFFGGGQSVCTTGARAGRPQAGLAEGSREMHWISTLIQQPKNRAAAFGRRAPETALRIAC